MEYFLLKQSSNVVNPIQIIELDMEKYVPSMTHQQFRELENVAIGYFYYKPECEYPDVINSPTIMVSDMIHKVLAMYDQNISFKTIQVFPDKPEYVKKESRTYWIYDCVMEDCLHPESQIMPNGEIKNIILDQKRMKNRDIFRVKGMLDNRIIISLPVAESILRRCPYGIELEKVGVK